MLEQKESDTNEEKVAFSLFPFSPSLFLSLSFSWLIFNFYVAVVSPNLRRGLPGLEEAEVGPDMEVRQLEQPLVKAD